MKRNFQLALQFIVFVFALNLISILVVMRPANALTPSWGWLSESSYVEFRSNDMDFDFVLDTNGNVTITVPEEFTGTGVTTNPDCAATAPGWATTHSITCTGLIAGAINVDINGLTNPVAGAYEAYIFTVNAPSETGPTSLEADLQIHTAGQDYMSSLMTGDNSSHYIQYVFEVEPVEDDTFTITFPTVDGFDCTGLVTGDVDPGSAWDSSVNAAACEIVLTANPGIGSSSIGVTIDAAHMVNPSSAGVYELVLSGSEIGNETVYLDIGTATGSDILSTYAPGVNSSHILTYSFGYPPGGSLFSVEFPTTDGFVCTGLVEGDITLSEGWSFSDVYGDTCYIEISADGYVATNPVVITIASTHMTNPIATGFYDILASGQNEDDDYNISVEITNTGSSSGSDLMTSLKTGTNSSHVISYTFITNAVESETFSVDFEDLNNDPDGFDCTGLVNADITLSSGWLLDGADPDGAVDPVSCEVFLIADVTPSNPVVITIESTHMVNPAAVGSYEIVLTGSGEEMTLQVAIVDSDTVDINGFISSSLAFDLDTTTEDSANSQDCDADSCLAYEDQTKTSPNNYTVDLGNLTIALVNKSSSASVLHADGDEGVINSIYFDISTNASSGAVITYKSAYGELRGPGHSTTIASDLDIPTVANGSTPIVAGTAAYGIQLAELPSFVRVGTGTQTVNCGASSGSYCVMGIIEEGTGNNTQAAQPIYTTTGPIEGGRGKIDVAAAVDGTNVPGTYTDQITFIATSTF